MEHDEIHHVNARYVETRSIARESRNLKLAIGSRIPWPAWRRAPGSVMLRSLPGPINSRKSRPCSSIARDPENLDQISALDEADKEALRYEAARPFGLVSDHHHLFSGCRGSVSGSRV